MSARDRGLIARNATGSANIFCTVSAANGTDPIKIVGRKRITARTSIFQQSPTAVREPTSATSLHQRETPTNSRRTPNESKIEVTLGASDTIRIFLGSDARAMVPTILPPCSELWHYLRHRGKNLQAKNKNAPERIALRRVRTNRKKSYCAASTFFRAGFGICQIIPESSALFG